MSKQKWTEEREATLVELVGTESPVTVSTVTAASDKLDVTIRSIASKLRNMDYEVESMAKVTIKSFSDDEEATLRNFVESNAIVFTYAEIAEQVCDGKFTAKAVQGKLLSMELTGSVKPTPKIEVAKKYTEEEEAKFIALMKGAAFLEDIAKELDKSLNSVRGKALSLTSADESLTMPKQKESHAANKTDALDDLGDKVAEMTVEEISNTIDRSERGVKTMLTRRGIDCANYKGAAKAAKIADKKAA